MKNIFEDLNDAQKEAVRAADGPVMVIAGAGSGKTRVLTYKVAYLLTQGTDPFNVLALTFTNKASREMKNRIIQLVGSDAKNVWMGTFHSVFARILRIEGHRLGYPSNFTIYDTDDSKSLIRNIIRDKDLDKQAYQVSYILNRISGAKTNLIAAAQYNNDPELAYADRVAGKPKTGEIYLAYEQRCFKAAAMDFDDLLFKTHTLLEHFPEVLYKYQQQFKYILVDEYQDTNHAQYLIIKKLAANNENICVVGDDAQSIYGFRGANIQNILSFRKDYPDQRTFKLEQNYRSTQTIVHAANTVIVNNKEQIAKLIWTENETGRKLKILHANTDNEEGTMVAQSIFEQKMNGQLPNDAFAILYRTNAQSRAMEEALRRINIPYRIFGGLSFYQRKEIKDILAYFRLVINPNDGEALNRVINFPARGIGPTTMQKAAVTADEQDLSLWETLERAEHLDMRLNSGTLRKIGEFITMITSFRIQLHKSNAFDLARQIAKASGLLKEYFEDKTVEGISRFENIEELLNGIKEFTLRERTAAELEYEKQLKLPQFRTLDEFMQEVALLTDADTVDPEDNNRVSLMTIHAAKGLEFPHVHIVGLEENLFPSIQSVGSRSDLEEERRLFYVALTRAQKTVTLSYAESRYRWGNLTISEPSRFLDEIDSQYLEFPKKSSIPGNAFLQKSSKSADENEPAGLLKLRRKNFKRLNSQPQHSDATQEFPDLQPGVLVLHEKFGKGKVINVEGDGSNKKATIFFREFGNKNILLRFAKLQIVND